MLIGKITIDTCYGRTRIEVQLCGKGPRPGSVWVKALGGLEPFTKISHGGPYQANVEIVSLEAIEDLHLEASKNQSQSGQASQRREIPNPAFLLDWFLEGAYEDRPGDE